MVNKISYPARYVDVLGNLLPDAGSQTPFGRCLRTTRLDGFSVDEYPVKPVHTKGKYFKRVAASNHQLALSEITDLDMQSLQLSWDAYEAPRQSLDALSWIKIEKFIEQVNLGGRFSLDSSPLLAREKLKYIANSRPTWAALLLFAEEPLRHHIHIGRFKTSAMIIDDRQITDTLFEGSNRP